MAVTDAQPPTKPGVSAHVANPMGTLLERSREQWREIAEDAKAYDLRNLYMEAMALGTLGRMENDTLKRLRLLARAQNAFEELSAQLKAITESIDRAAIELGAKVIPSIMEDVGIDQFGLTEGTIVKVEERVHASLKKENLERGCAWLQENGHAAIIKRTLTVPFTTRQGELAEKVKQAAEAALKGENVAVTDARTVHPSTLGAWVRERLREGDDFPMDLFSVHRQRVAKIVEK
jgi:hypothetical protein